MTTVSRAQNELFVVVMFFYLELSCPAMTCLILRISLSLGENCQISSFAVFDEDLMVLDLRVVLQLTNVDKVKSGLVWRQFWSQAKK